ncbi:OmpA family protein [Roseobacter sp. N2S]|uniref:OmpA family protein n=1 Tax=Roseobacter sp. N2S TaxID=2663844 RepID=UPI0028667EC8|nr:OmpA family protein [Roseobacter sp. N2S]MDR6266462.1 OOP family OmpA-OmpF porin [Roseobacter sp. N2S]
MHRTALLFSAISFILVAAGSLFLGTRAVDYIQNATQQQVDTALRASGQNWATIRPDGLVVHLTGLAPDEAARLQALEIMGQVIDANRISDRTTVLQSSEIVEPRFSLEMLRNVDRISLIGLIPEKVGRGFILDRAAKIANGGTVTDMLESTEHRVPSGWARNLDFGLSSLEQLPRSKISVTPDAVRITAVTESPEEQKRVEKSVREAKPEGVVLLMDITAPRPVITPFHFRILMDDTGFELQSCSADTNDARDRILRAVRAAGAEQTLSCDVGLGVPTTEWDQAIIQSVQALKSLGGGTLSVADSDISLVANDKISQSRFDNVVGGLENSLPELFSLHATLPPKILQDGAQKSAELPEFTATRSPEGQVQLRGRIQNALAKQSIGAFARSLFGSSNVDNATRIDPELPDGWPTRVLAGLEGLSKMHHGAVVVQPEQVTIRGISANPEITSELTGLFAQRIGDGDGYTIDVKHDPKLIPKVNALDSRQCEAQIRAVLLQQQIVFAPSSTTIEAGSQGVLDAIADIIKDCPDTRFEIEGHTDSQGGAEMNRSLSQQRAEAVLNGLLARRILISGFTAKGYGEDQPIAGNDTEEGRAANRRIAFRLITEDPQSPEEDTDE